HEERRRNERDTDERRAEHPRAHPSEIDRELCGQRPRSELRDRDPVLVFARRHPTAPLHQIALHEAHERDGTTPTEAPQREEIEQDRPQRGRGHGRTRWVDRGLRDVASRAERAGVRDARAVENAAYSASSAALTSSMRRASSRVTAAT